MNINPTFQPVFICFENGFFLEAQSFGAEGTYTGEVVFNTSMSGYQEIISDPSYAGQFVAFTFPEIGIVGCNDQDMESKAIFAKGILVHHYSSFVSNFRAKQDLSSFLKDHGAMGLCSLPIRKIVKMIRNEGAMMMIASTQINDRQTLLEMLKQSPRIEHINHVACVSTKEPYTHNQATFDFSCMDYPVIKNGKKIVAIDFGIKRNILNCLVEAGFDVCVIPHEFDALSLIDQFNRKAIDAVFLSNGPGDPKLLQKEIEQIKILSDANVPIFAICLGHQLLSIAQGYPTYKLKFGHHGANHPVKNMRSGTVEITAQNHIYSVPEEIANIAHITHRNLFDGTIEGLQYKNRKIYSVQHHPEASPGPKEASNIFEEFMSLLDSNV